MWREEQETQPTISQPFAQGADEDLDVSPETPNEEEETARRVPPISVCQWIKTVNFGLHLILMGRVIHSQDCVRGIVNPPPFTMKYFEKVWNL